MFRMALPALSFLFAATPAFAADNPLLPPETKPAAKSDFLQGSWYGSKYIGFNRECAGDPELTYAAIGGNYFIWDHVSIGLELRGYYASQEAGDDAGVIELDFVFRHHFLVRENWSIFADITIGVSQASEDLPAGGTQFNFIEEAGLGATYRLNESMHLIGGVRYWHLSNAQIDGADRNPALNGYGVYFGLMFKI